MKPCVVTQELHYNVDKSFTCLNHSFNSVNFLAHTLFVIYILLDYQNYIVVHYIIIIIISRLGFEVSILQEPGK